MLAVRIIALYKRDHGGPTGETSLHLGGVYRCVSLGVGTDTKLNLSGVTYARHMRSGLVYYVVSELQ